jgi:hypothetical protein
MYAVVYVPHVCTRLFYGACMRRRIHVSMREEDTCMYATLLRVMCACVE